MFLLTTDVATDLYHNIAKELPIIDFHNHLSATDIAKDRTFSSITELWIAPDPYKHRMMRIAGIPEELITGKSSAREKFDAWALVVPQTLGNPLFHWCQMELQHYFSIDEILSPATADIIWNQCNEQLKSPDYSAKNLLRRSRIETLCTSNSSGENLGAHRRLACSDFPIQVIPSLRDPQTVDEKVFTAYEALGCHIVDHSVEHGQQLKELIPLAKEYARRGWVMQLHLGACRNTNSRLKQQLGPAGGYATMAGAFNILSLIEFFDTLDQVGALPKTIVFPLNPIDYASFCTLTGSFAPQVTVGPAWWYNDHQLGMVNHFENMSAYGMLSTFVGMTTDSRSILSMIRHDYFRRILCSWLGEQVKLGRMPNDDILLGSLINSICYTNAKKTFNLTQT